MGNDFLAVHNAYMRGKQQKLPKKRYRPTFIRQWRLHRNLTLEQTAELVSETIHTTHATLSRIERGMSPYSQGLLERLAEVFRTDPASLLSLDPANAERARIVRQVIDTLHNKNDG